MSFRRLRYRLELRYGEPARRAQYLWRAHPRTGDAPQLSITPFVSTTSERRDASGRAWTYVALDAPHDHVCFDSVFAWRPEAGGAVPNIPWTKTRDEVLGAKTPDAIDAAASAVSADDFAPPIEALDADLALRDVLARISARSGGQGLSAAANALRRLGLPARYARGVILDVAERPEPKSWLEVYVGSGAWLGWDPVKDEFVKNCMILARGRQLDDIAPLRVVAVGVGTWTVTQSLDFVPEAAEAVA